LKIAVTGATGFIGKHVVSALLDLGHVPTLLLREGTQVPKPFERCQIVRFDLGDCPDDAYARLDQPDLLIHLAWGGLPNYKSLHHLSSELPAQFAFLSSLVRSGLPRLFVSGTCLEYGLKCGELKETEATNPCIAYGLAKDSLCKMLTMLARESAFELVWGRLFYTCGSGQAPTSLHSSLTAAVSRGETVFDMSGGEQLRDFLPAADLAHDIAKLAMSENSQGVFNICSGNPISIRRLVESEIEKNDWKIRLNLGQYSYPDYEPMAFWGSREKLNNIIKIS